MDILKDIIPAGGRKYVYAAYALGSLLLACLGVLGIGALGGIALAKWVIVWGLVGTAVGATAASNVDTAPVDN